MRERVYEACYLKHKNPSHRWEELARESNSSKKDQLITFSPQDNIIVLAEY
jgi:hypothetical protein